MLSGKPLALGEEMLGRTVDEVSGAAASLDERESLHFVAPKLRVDLFPRAPGDGVTVVWATGFELGDHMAEAQREIGNLLQRKEHQAESIDTILLVDISGVGQSWIRPPAVWKQPLEKLLGDAPWFAGLGVFFSPIDRLYHEGVMVLNPAASATAQRCGRDVAAALDLLVN